jgi:hypothetical protein
MHGKSRVKLRWPKSNKLSHTHFIYLMCVIKKPKVKHEENEENSSLWSDDSRTRPASTCKHPQPIRKITAWHMTAKTKTLSSKNESQNQDENRATVALPFGLTAPNHARENGQETSRNRENQLVESCMWTQEPRADRRWRSGDIIEKSASEIFCTRTNQRSAPVGWKISTEWKTTGGRTQVENESLRATNPRKLDARKIGWEHEDSRWIQARQRKDWSHEKETGRRNTESQPERDEETKWTENPTRAEPCGWCEHRKNSDKKIRPEVRSRRSEPKILDPKKSEHAWSGTRHTGDES